MAGPHAEVAGIRVEPRSARRSARSFRGGIGRAGRRAHGRRSGLEPTCVLPAEGAGSKTLSRIRCGRCVHLDEAEVVVGDLRGRILAGEVAFDPALQRIAPDRPTDCEADVSLDRSSLAEPMVDLVVVGTATEHDADDAARGHPRGTGRRFARSRRARRRPRSSRCRTRFRRPAAHGSRGSSGRGAARRRSDRSHRPPRRAGPPPPAPATRRGTCDRARVASPRGVAAARPGAGSSRSRHRGCSERAPSRSRGRSARCGRRSRRRTRSRNSFWPLFSTGIASLMPRALACWGTSVGPPNCSSTSAPVADGSAPRASAASIPSKIRCLPSAKRWLSSAVGSPSTPKRFVNDPR